MIRAFASAAIVVAMALCAVVPRIASAAASRDGCTGFIEASPGATTTLAAAGTWCLDHDLVAENVPMTFIDIDASDVTVDCRGHGIRLGSGLTQAIEGLGVLRTAVRNCRIEGFTTGIRLEHGPGGEPDGFLVEDNVLVGNDQGIEIVGDASVVRRNRIHDSADTAISVRWGDVDIIDNRIDGVAQTPSHLSAAIFVTDGQGTQVRGNTIRGLAKLAGEEDNVMSAIWVRWTGQPGIPDGPVTIHDNVFVGTPETVGLQCDISGVRYRDNVITGFAAPTTGECVDTGDNDVTP